MHLPKRLSEDLCYGFSVGLLYRTPDWASNIMLSNRSVMNVGQEIPFLERVASLENMMNKILEKLEIMEVDQVRA